MTQEEIIIKIKKCVFYTYMLGNQITDEELDEIGNFIKRYDTRTKTDITENELKEKLVDAIYIIVKRVPDFSPDYNQIAKNGADVIMDIIKEYNKNV